ncbi:dynein regulatory complex protein 11-like [Helicoverpa zea]|uniref:dynein regulatory complex protein 11-like n=1 Tax=Helicoverpa zea TaxID=7113 RepID=UPI001F5904DD|nr:dynein regulatory complex protein 11-like [Helicoverpa zea]
MIIISFQETKVHDQKLPQAVHRSSSFLGQYIMMYNQMIQCCQQNLQVQKTAWLDSILNAVILRIIELKQHLEKLEGSRFQFLGYGLIEVHHTVYDIGMTKIPKPLTRPAHIQAKLEDIFAVVKEKRMMAQIEEEAAATVETEKPVEWWDAEANGETTSNKEPSKKDNIPEALQMTRKYLALIMAHEKTRFQDFQILISHRQVITWDKHRKLTREMWEKDLMGELKPKARPEVRKRSANLIHTVFRVYFKLKRERIERCKRDELLGLNLCDAPIFGVQQEQAEEFFYDIPKEGSVAIFKGEIPDPLDWLKENTALALKKEADKKKSPQDLKFQKLEAKKQAMLQKREEQMNMKAEALLLKKMMKNPTMHPGYTYPPSKYTGDIVKAIDYYHKSWDMFDVWETMDVKEKHVDIINLNDAIMQVQLEVLPEVDEEMRQELRKLKQALKNDYKTNEEEMPVNLTKRPKRKRVKKAPKSKFDDKVVDMIEVNCLQQSYVFDECDRIHNTYFLQNLIEQGFILEYPKQKLEDFIGDPNFGGEDLRAQTLPASPFHFEIRQYWWERCRDVSCGFRRMLLVGPDCSGRTNLIYALASVNDAVLFELDPHNVQGGSQSAPFLKRLVKMVVTCARALQPSVIRIKNVEKLFYSKIPPEEADMNLKIIRSYFVTKLFKTINKADNITVIGKVFVICRFLDITVEFKTRVTLAEQAWQSKTERITKFYWLLKMSHLCSALVKFASKARICILFSTATCTEPWLATASALLKQFPEVLLLPNNGYSLVVQVLKEWVYRNKVIPADLNVSNLARVLQGYSFGYLQDALDKFMSADRIVKIAAYGLSPMEVYDYFLEDTTQTTVEYDKYLVWYNEKTAQGIKEVKHLEDQREFNAAFEKYVTKKQKKKKAKSAPSSAAFK